MLFMATLQNFCDQERRSQQHHSFDRPRDAGANSITKFLQQKRRFHPRNFFQWVRKRLDNETTFFYSTIFTHPYVSGSSPYWIARSL